MEKFVLNYFASRVHSFDFEQLEGKGGFDDPNDFSWENVKTPILAEEYPRSDYYEYTLNWTNVENLIVITTK